MGTPSWNGARTPPRARAPGNLGSGMLEGCLKTAFSSQLSAFLLFLLLENKARGEGGCSRRLRVGWGAGQGPASPPGDFGGIAALPGLHLPNEEVNGYLLSDN